MDIPLLQLRMVHHLLVTDMALLLLLAMLIPHTVLLLQLKLLNTIRMYQVPSEARCKKHVTNTKKHNWLQQIPMLQVVTTRD